MIFSISIYAVCENAEILGKVYTGSVSLLGKSQNNVTHICWVIKKWLYASPLMSNWTYIQGDSLPDQQTLRGDNRHEDKHY